MKRLLIIIGLLIIAAPVYASDASWETSDRCKTILSLPEVSPYVTSVLARADEGLATAHEASIDTAFDINYYAEQTGSAWAALIGREQGLKPEDLTGMSACLRFDMAAIECKMDQVKHEMHAQLSRGSVVATLQLQYLLTFLSDRLAQVRNGALDPLYADPTWSDSQAFDPEENADAGNDVRMCPYSSDYGPALQNGYGCDLSVLAPRIGVEWVRAEYEALQALTTSLNAYKREAGQNVTQQTHLRAAGCGWTGGLCDNDSSVRCASDMECGGGTCVFPGSVCKENHTIRCSNDVDCQTETEDVGPCVADDGIQPAMTALRGPFSIVKKQLELLTAFLRNRTAQGNARLFPRDLQTADEVSSQDTQALENLNNEPGIYTLTRQQYRALNAAWSRYQGAQEASTFPVASDPSLEIAEALKPLREAISGLARLTRIDPNQEKKTDLRSFVIRFASFLLRSCTDRACNASLEEVLKIAFKDECFPYTNGEFLDDTEQNPRSRKCANAAGLSVP